MQSEMMQGNPKLMEGYSMTRLGQFKEIKLVLI